MPQNDPNRVRLQAPDGKFYTLPSNQVGTFLGKHPSYKLAPSSTPAATATGPLSNTVLGHLMVPGAQHIGAPPPLFSKAGIKEKLYQGADIGTKALPTIGATVGGIAGTGAEPGLGSIAGAGIGGAFGKEAEQVARKAIFNEPTPTTLLGELGSVGKEGGLQALYEIAGMGIGRGAKLLAPADRVALLSYGGRSGEFGEKIKNVLPDLDRTAATIGKPKNIGELENVVKATERGLNNEFNQAIFPIAQQPVVAHSVASAIRQEITPNLAKTAQGRATARYLQSRAVEFERGTWTIGELNSERELISKRLRAYYNAVASGQSTMAKVQGAIAADTAAESALKDIIYREADQAGIKPAGYFKALKQRQSALIDLSDSFAGAKEKLTKASLESKGAPLSSKIHLRGFMHPQSTMPSAAAGVNASLFTDPLKQSAGAIQKAFPTGTRAATQSLRSGTAKALSIPEVNALPIRVLLMEAPKEQETPK